MKAIAYNIKNDDKEYLVKANAKKHEFTFISNELDEDTLLYSLDKDAVILHNINSLNLDLLIRLKDFGIKQIISRTDKPSPDIIRLALDSGILINHVHCSLNDEKKAQMIIMHLDKSSALNSF